MIETTGQQSRSQAATDQRSRLRPVLTGLLGWIAPALALIALLLIWEIGVRIDNTPKWFLPRPTVIFQEAYHSRSLLWANTVTTLKEIFLGYSIAFVVGVVSALAISASRLAERTLYPLIVASQAIPIIALAPILLIWFGYGLTPKVIVVVMICYFPIAVNMADGLRSADRDALALLYSMGASRWQVMRLVKIPSSLPYLISGARIAAAVSVIGAVVGEWIGASSGLGYLMTRSASQFLTARLFAAVFIAAIIGVVLFALVALLGRILVPWQDAGRVDER